MVISVSLQGPPISSALTFFRESQKRKERALESSLLKSIRSALRGSGADVDSVHSSTALLGDDSSKTAELSWDAHTVVLSEGGVLKKKWNFEEECQSIQWACLGWLEQAKTVNSTATSSPHGHSRYSSDPDEFPLPFAADSAPKATFGPFARVGEHERRVAENAESPVRTVFVFLRSIGKMFLWNGLEYTFGLPFIVRRAWALHPHGVMIQRVLEPYEIEEAKVTGDIALPTLFSLTSPYAEPGAVGVTTGILRGVGKMPASLEDEDENSTRPLKSVPPTELVVSVTSRGFDSQTEDIVATIDVEKRHLTIWRYAYIRPKDIPVPLDSHRTRNILSRKRTSLIAGKPRHTASAAEVVDRTERFPPLSPGHQLDEQPHEVPAPPIPAFAGVPPALSTTTTMASLVAGTSQPSQWPDFGKGRRTSLTRNDLSVTMDRMVLGGRLETDTTLAPIEHGRMRSAHWMQELHSEQIPDTDCTADAWRNVSLALFDHRWDGVTTRSLMAVCFPVRQALSIFSLTYEEDRVKLLPLSQTSAISIASLRATRDTIYDLLVLKPDNRLVLFAQGLHELRIEAKSEPKKKDGIETGAGYDSQPTASVLDRKIVSLRDPVRSSVVLAFADDSESCTFLDFVPKDPLTLRALYCLSAPMSADAFFALHGTFLTLWSASGFRTSDGMEWNCFVTGLLKLFELEEFTPASSPRTHWEFLSKSPSANRFRDDPALGQLRNRPSLNVPIPLRSVRSAHLQLLGPVLYTLHMLGEDLRMQINHHQYLLRLAPLICCIALVIRPEWADYWKRICPEAWPTWPTSKNIKHLDDRLPVWPPDMSAVLHGRISNPEWKVPWHEQFFLDTLFLGIFTTSRSFAFGKMDSLPHLHGLANIYTRLADGDVGDSQKRAENAIQAAVHMDKSIHISLLPLGLAAPIHEAARTCQLSPPGDWSVAGYTMIGRNDLAASVTRVPDVLSNDGYRAVKDHINSSQSRKTINGIVRESAILAGGEIDAVSGVELDLEDFTTIRFGQDRRLEEVARMLCSSAIPTIKIIERPDLNEHDQAKEQQVQVIRIAERTLALPYGRAMFTFSTVPTVTREAYAIPKLEYAVRMQPQNITTAPEPGKIPQECLNWGEFHNGVAAGLRIASTSTGVESSWIAFNKPSELTPEHAGFLYGLGLTGHLREMLTWHTFAYLTPKHDLTSIGVLLGLSAANLGTGNRHVTKLLAVHTPALLPTPGVDLNVSLLTQAAGLAGVGLLYMGSKNRRMAEVCLSQISRKDLIQPDLSNEHREAYTYAAALAFGMIMLGKGSSVPADLTLLSRLRVLIHGGAHTLLGPMARPPFDINLTSPAATIGLGLMFLRTERRDVADVLTIPDTVLGLNRIQPSFLLMRTVARALIMWNSIAPTNDWLQTQLPNTIANAVEARWQGKAADDAFELAYYNILAGCCFAIGLKYAGTARQEAYLLIITYFDMFSRLVYSNNPAFNHKIKRSAVREGLSLISISLSMVMAGTGEITCFRRLRYAYGMYHQAFRYGVHVATHLSLGLLFLGGGRFTLGTSDAAIACMVTAFFPRSHHVSADNKSYLQALRHLWVLAAEPRCLVARDVDTNEVVYLPVKITTRDGVENATTQLVAPTLIPDLDKLISIRVDTPRYWPFYIDIENVTRRKEALLRNQTLYVKRRTAFLSYTEDPRGSRSLFVRSGSSAGDAATLDYPQLADASTHPAGDLSQFISSFSNNTLFLAFADHFSREDGETPEEHIFHNYCRATLLDSLLQDKPQTLQQHLTLYQYRTMSTRSPYFHLRLQDLRFGTDFYSKVYDRRFSGRMEHNARTPLIRENTMSGSLHALDEKLESIRLRPDFVSALGQYASGEVVDVSGDLAREMAWYLLRNGVPVSTVLAILNALARDAHAQCLGAAPPGGTTDGYLLDLGIKEVLHAAGSKMGTGMGSGWSVRSLDEILSLWAAGQPSSNAPSVPR